MNFKFFTIVTAILTTIFAVQASYAQTKENKNLEELCLKFPNNSKCAGIESPVPLESRAGEEYSCTFEFAPGELEPKDKCKVNFTAEGVTVYQEAGDKLDLIDNKRTTVEVNIPRDRIFITNYQVWHKIDRWQLGFVTEATEKQPAQTNFVTIIAEEDKVEVFEPQAKALGANQPEIVEPILTQAIDAAPNIEQIIETKECEYCDLSNADLSDVDLKGANLVGANLQGANLQEANLEGAYLLGANLQGADLTDADLKEANLTFADLSESIAVKTDFAGVNLQAANLAGATLEEARLTAPALLKQANLSTANLVNADLRGTNFNGANLQQADLTNANLDQIDVIIRGIPGNYTTSERLQDAADAIRNDEIIGTGTGLIGGYAQNGTGIDFPTDFLDADLSGANLTNTSLDKVIFEQTNLTNADFTESNLDSEKLEEQPGVKLCGIIFPDGSTSDRDCQ